MTRRTELDTYGPWAVITGASSGIGEAFAHQLAAAGLHVVLAARRRPVLEAVAASIGADHGVSTRVVTVDLTAEGAAAQLDDATADLDVGLLVSNAGGGSPGGFLRQDLAAHAESLRLNVVGPMELAHRFGNRLVARSADGQRRGGIIVTGSTGGYVGAANLANYLAAKSYLMTLAEGLHFELRSHGVDVTVLAAGPTRTALVDTAGMDTSKMRGVAWMEAAEVAAAGLAALGRRQTVVPGAANRLMTGAMRRLVSRRIAGAAFSRILEPAIDEPLRASAGLATTAH